MPIETLSRSGELGVACLGGSGNEGKEEKEATELREVVESHGAIQIDNPQKSAWCPLLLRAGMLESGVRLDANVVGGCI